MDMAQGQQAGAGDPGIVVGYYQKHRVVPIVGFFCLIEELPYGPVGIAHGVLYGGRVAVGNYAAAGVFPRRMVADGKSQGERGLIGRRAEQVVYGIEHVLDRKSTRLNSSP